jgi:Tfp pilus assembly protein PilF
MVNNENKHERIVRVLERNGIDLGKYGWIIALVSLMISNKGGVIGIILGIITCIVCVARFHPGLGSAIFMFFLIPILLGILGAVVGIVVKKRYWGGIIGIIPGAILYVVSLIGLVFVGKESKESEEMFEALGIAFFTMIILGIIGMIIGAIIKFIAKIIKGVANPRAKAQSSITTNSTEDSDSEIKKRSNASEYVDRGKADMENGDNDSAIANFTKAIGFNPNYAEAYFCCGVTYSTMSDFELAIPNYTEAIRLDPNYGNAYLLRAKAYYEVDDYDNAITDYTTIIRHEPDSVLGYHFRGLAYSEKGDFDKAIIDYNEAIRLDPTSAGTYYVRGISHSKLDHVQEAIRDYEKFLELDPNPDPDNEEMVLAVKSARDALRELKGDKTMGT